jgi:hypothetical protein
MGGACVSMLRPRAVIALILTSRTGLGVSPLIVVAVVVAVVVAYLATESLSAVRSAGAATAQQEVRAGATSQST